MHLYIHVYIHQTHMYYLHTHKPNSSSSYWPHQSHFLGCILKLLKGIANSLYLVIIVTCCIYYIKQCQCLIVKEMVYNMRWTHKMKHYKLLHAFEKKHVNGEGKQHWRCWKKDIYIYIYTAPNFIIKMKGQKIIIRLYSNFLQTCYVLGNCAKGLT